MSKAEERALEKYPKKIEWVGNQWDGAPLDVNSEKRFGYQHGYHQAEKDLELTWEDIKLLDKIFMDEKIMSGLILGKKEYEEILKRFKENR